MNLALSVRYVSREYKCLCFTHAVQEAMKGKRIEVEVDEFGRSGNDMRQTWCELCSTSDEILT